MKQVLVIGASGGIGAALCAAVVARGDRVTPLSRARDGLDVTDPAAVDRVLGALERRFDLIIQATGILAGPGGAPEKSLDAISAAEMAAVLATNTIGPALVLRHVPRLLRRDAPAVVGILSARVGSIGDNRIGGWHSYRASKAALNQIVRGAAIELGRSHPQAAVVALHPGTVATPFTAAYAGRHKTVTPDMAAADLLTVMAGLTAADTGQFLDYRGESLPW
jgi:NAD(P)-dependent dehydrogenase (short-subunit alcohol dehydrogenase family)